METKEYNWFTQRINKLVWGVCIAYTKPIPFSMIINTIELAETFYETQETYRYADSEDEIKPFLRPLGEPRIHQMPPSTTTGGRAIVWDRHQQEQTHSYLQQNNYFHNYVYINTSENNSVLPNDD